MPAGKSAVETQVADRLVAREYCNRGCLLVPLVRVAVRTRRDTYTVCGPRSIANETQSSPRQHRHWFTTRKTRRRSRRPGCYSVRLAPRVSLSPPPPSPPTPLPPPSNELTHCEKLEFPPTFRRNRQSIRGIIDGSARELVIPVTSG